MANQTFSWFRRCNKNAINKTPKIRAATLESLSLLFQLSLEIRLFILPKEQTKKEPYCSFFLFFKKTQKTEKTNSLDTVDQHARTQESAMN